MLVAVRYSAAADADGCILTDAESGSFVRVDPLKGNNVTAFRVRHGRDPLDLLTARGAPILFPFPNRVPEGRFRFRGREYRLDVNERDFRNHIHGFARHLPWTVLALGADDDGAWVRAAVELHRFPDVSRHYPFPRRGTVTTRLPRRLDGWTEAGVRYPDAGLTIRVEASPAFREIVVFAPNDQDAVCLEPYTAPTNAVNLAERGFPAGTVALEAGSSWEGAVRISAAG